MPKPRRGQSVAVDVAGAEAAIQGHAQQAIATETMPGKDASPDAWATYVNAARGRAAAAVIEWGQRIGMAHRAYSAQPQQWGRTWDDWCQQHLGIGKRHADRLQVIGQNLGLGKSHILPAATDQLYTLARLRQDAPAAFDAAVESGTISPALTREQAQSLFKAATAAPSLPAAEEPARPQSRRIAGITWDAALADKFEAIAASRNQTPAQVVSEIMRAWVTEQPMPEGVTTVDTTVISD